MDTITFKMDPALAKKLKAEPSRNRLFNTHSDICRDLVRLYLTDFSVKKAVDSALRRELRVQLGIDGV